MLIIKLAAHIILETFAFFLGKEYFVNLIFIDSCIVDDSVEIPTRCNPVIEFIIPKFIEGSTCFERHTAHHQELQTVFSFCVSVCKEVHSTVSFNFV